MNSERKMGFLLNYIWEFLLQGGEEYEIAMNLLFELFSNKGLPKNNPFMLLFRFRLPINPIRLGNRTK